MAMTDGGAPRTFKTAWFSKAARKALIADKELCDAIGQVRMGQADDLGGGVFKKRLDKNRHRSIILARGGDFWVYQYLFAKQDRDNIEDHELKAFRLITKDYATMTQQQADAQVTDGHWIEICRTELEQGS